MNTRVATWEERLGSVLSVECRRELDSGQVALDDPAIFVHLSAGTIEEVRPADSMAITKERVLILYRASLIAQYTRSDVSFCSKAPIQPFFS